MIDADAAVLFALAGLYVYAAVFYGAMHRLGGQAIHLLKALSLGAFALYVVGLAQAEQASDVWAGAYVQPVQQAAALVAIALFADTLTRLYPAALPPGWMRFGYGLCFGGAALALTGWFADPSFPRPGYDWALDSVERPVAVWGPSAIVLFAAAVAVCGLGLVRVALAARHRPELRVAVGCSLVGLALGIAELGGRAAGMGLPPLSAWSALAALTGVSTALTGRVSQVDDDLEKRRRELAESYDHLRDAQQAILEGERQAAVGELSAIVALELRSPLGLVRSAVRGLRRAELRPDDRVLLLGILDEESDRMNALVDDLLAYARPVTLAARPVDLRSLTRHAVESAASVAADPGRIELELELDAPVEPVLGDERLLRFAVLNLVESALRTVPRGGVLTVGCRPGELLGRPAVAVELEESRGMLATVARVSARDPLRRGADQRERGLAIVDRVARLHGGQVALEALPRGARVRLLLPASEA